jgi:YD repeat-containing protein
VLREFNYDADGHLVEVRERTGDTDNVTTIERADGRPVAIAGPFGQRTQLTIDAQGYLSGVITPAGETIQLVHDAGGLLAQLVDPRGGVHRFTYDPLGLLIRDEAPDGGATTLARTVAGNVATVTLTTAGGRITTYRTELLSNDALRR